MSDRNKFPSLIDDYYNYYNRISFINSDYNSNEKIFRSLVTVICNQNV